MKNDNQLDTHSKNLHTVLRVTIYGIFLNVVITAAKLVFGIVFSNFSVIADSATNILAIVAGIFVVLAVYMANPKRDKKYNYGHEKIEPLILLLFATVIFAVGGFLLWQGIEGILNPAEHEISIVLIIIMASAIISQELMFQYCIRLAKKIGSEALKVDAWQSRIDGLSSIAVLVGLILGVFIGTNIAESIAVVIVSGAVFKMAYSICKTSFLQVTDRAANSSTCEKIKRIARAQEGVMRIERLRTRRFGGHQIYADIVIIVDGNMTTANSYALGSSVHDILKSDETLHIKGCNVIVKPHEIIQDLDGVSTAD